MSAGRCLGHVDVSVGEPQGWVRRAKSLKRITTLRRYPARRKVVQIVNQHDAGQAVGAEIVESPACQKEAGKRSRREEIQMRVKLSFRVALETAWAVGVGAASPLASPEPTKV